MTRQPERPSWGSHSVHISIRQDRTHCDFSRLPNISTYPTNTTNIELPNVLGDWPYVTQLPLSVI